MASGQSTANVDVVFEAHMKGFDSWRDRMEKIQDQTNKKLAQTDARNKELNKTVRQQAAENARLQKQLERTAQARQRDTAAANGQTAAINKATKGNAKMAQAFNQAGFAVEDFFSVYGTMGAAGGIRAANNNLSMVARILAGPGLVGAFVGIGASLATLVLPAISEWLEGVKKIEMRIQNLLKVQNTYNLALQRQVDFANKLEGMTFSSPEGAESALKTVSTEADTLQQKLKLLQDEQKVLGQTVVNSIPGYQRFFRGLQAQQQRGLITPWQIQQIEKARKEFERIVDSNPAANLSDEFTKMQRQINDIVTSTGDMFDLDIFTDVSRFRRELSQYPGMLAENVGLRSNWTELLGVDPSDLDELESKRQSLLKTELENKERLKEIEKEREQIALRMLEAVQREGKKAAGDLAEMTRDKLMLSVQKQVDRINELAEKATAQGLVVEADRQSAIQRIFSELQGDSPESKRQRQAISGQAGGGPTTTEAVAGAVAEAMMQHQASAMSAEKEDKQMEEFKKQTRSLQKIADELVRQGKIPAVRLKQVGV